MAIRIYIILLSLVLSTNLQSSLADTIPMDMLLMIDGSGSVRPHNFEKLKVFLQNIVDRLDVGPGKVNVALIQFSSRELTKVEFNLDAHDSKDAVKKAISDVKYQQRYTYTGHALKLARNEVFNGRGGDRPNAKNVILLFTDGEAADPHIARAETKKLKARKAHVMSVGFGQKKSVEKFKHELETMATNKDKDVFSRGFEDLEKIEQRLIQAVQPKADCSTSPCKNLANCENVGDSFRCHCTEEYEGFTCNKKKGPCARKPCLNDGTCLEEGETYKCTCSDKFHGILCEKEKVVCKTRNADILFLMDGSRSIGKSDFIIMKNFIIKLVDRFNISRDESRVALIQFSEEKKTIVEFHLDENYSKESIMNKIESITSQKGGSTFTDVALKVARENVFNGNRGDRTGIRDVLVLLTDGEAHRTDDAIREAKMLQDDDVSVISIGVGQGENNKNFYKLLQAMASDPDYVFKVSFSELDTILDGVIKAACENLRDV